MLTSAIGAGVLSLPFVAKQCGVALAAIFLALGGLVSFISLRVLMWCSYQTGIKDYGKLIKKCLGNVRELMTASD